MGDKILTVDQQSVYQAISSPGKRVGDKIEIQVLRGGKVLWLTLELTRPDASLLFERFSPVVIAFGFWLSGLLILTFAESSNEEFAVFIFSQAISVILSLGAASAMAPNIISRLFGVSLLWIGPLTIHTHVYFPYTKNNPITPYKILFLYGITFFLNIFYFIIQSSIVPYISSATIQNFVLIWLGLCLFFWIGMLLRFYRCTNSMEVRKKIGTVAVGALFSISPFLFLSLLPDMIFQVSVLPYQVSFLFLLGLPLIYGYAILRYRLIRIEKYIQRIVAYGFLIIVIGGLFSIGYLGIQKLFFPSTALQVQIPNLIIVIVIVMLSHPLYLRIQHGLDNILYGGWYEDTQVIQRISQSIDQAEGSEKAVATMLCQTMQETLQVEYSHIILRDGSVVSPDQGIQTYIHPEDAITIVKTISKLNQSKKLAIGRFQEFRFPEQFCQETIQFIFGKRPNVWIYLSEKGQFLALLILSYRRGGGEVLISKADVLEVIARHAKIAFQNAYLLKEAQEHSIQLAQAHQQVVHMQEEERKRLARNLHDEIIQTLVGINYQVSSLGRQIQESAKDQLLDIQTDVQVTIGQLRQICSDLRPPALDSLGLVSAIRSRIAEIEQQHYFLVEYTVEGREDQIIPENIALSVYRVFQEATVNITKHASATQVKVILKITPSLVTLVVQDNGCGFTVPPSLRTFVREHHFGLVGAKETIDELSGLLEVSSIPGAGCCITAQIPLTGTN